MSSIKIDKLKKKNLDCLTYLSKLEKILLDKKVKSPIEKLRFRSLIIKHHTKEEIEMMKNDLELNLNKHNEYNKILVSIVTSFFISLFAFVSAMIMFLFNSQFQIAIKAVENKEKVSILDMGALIGEYGYMWLITYIAIIVITYISINKMPNRRILYLAILKSI